MAGLIDTSMGSRILALVNSIPGALMPGSQGPIATGNESSVDTAAQNLAAAQYRNNYMQGLSRAARDGTPWWGANAEASAPAQDAYAARLQQAMQAAAQIKAQRDQDAIEAAQKNAIRNMTPEKQAMAAGMTSAQLGDMFQKQMTAVPKVDPLGNGMVSVTNPDGTVEVKSIGESGKFNGGLYQIGPDGQIKWTVLPKAMQDADPSVIRQGMKEAQAAAASAQKAKGYDSLARRVIAYNAAPPGSRSTNPEFWTAMDALDPNNNYDQKRWEALKKMEVQFGSGKQGDSVRSISVSIDHMDSLADAFKMMNAGDNMAMNEAANVVSRITGQPAVPKFEAMRDIVADEVAKGVIGSTMAASDREAFAKRLAAASSPAAMNEVMVGFKTLLGGQLGGLERQYVGSGSPEQRQARSQLFRQVLSNESNNMLDHYHGTQGGGTGTGASGSWASGAGSSGTKRPSLSSFQGQ